MNALCDPSPCTRTFFKYDRMASQTYNIATFQ
jgi:hypothetical protein